MWTAEGQRASEGLKPQDRCLVKISLKEMDLREMIAHTERESPAVSDYYVHHVH